MQYYRCQNCLKSHPACRQTMIQALIAAERIEDLANTALRRCKDTRDRQVKIETTCPSYEPRDPNFEEKWTGKNWTIIWEDKDKHENE